MTDFNTLQLEHDARGFATLWLNRPDKHNAWPTLRSYTEQSTARIRQEVQEGLNAFLDKRSPYWQKKRT